MLNVHDIGYCKTIVPVRGKAGYFQQSLLFYRTHLCCLSLQHQHRFPHPLCGIFLILWSKGLAFRQLYACGGLGFSSSLWGGECFFKTLQICTFYSHPGVPNETLCCCYWFGVVLPRRIAFYCESVVFMDRKFCILWDADCITSTQLIFLKNENKYFRVFFGGVSFLDGNWHIISDCWNCWNTYDPLLPNFQSWLLPIQHTVAVLCSYLDYTFFGLFYYCFVYCSFTLKHTHIIPPCLDVASL